MINLPLFRAGGRCERLGSQVGSQGERAFDEIGPDWGRRVAANHSEVMVIVESDPDDRQQLRGVAGEPGVMRTARLARRRPAIAQSSDACTRVAIDRFSQG